MAQTVNRGEIWMFVFAAPNKRRPVLVLTRSSLVGRLRDVVVASITSTLHGTAVEVPVGIDEGLKHPSAVNLVNLQTVPRADLHQYVGSLSPEKMHEVCRALIVSAGCEPGGS
jgi:mRNA interferase MazF